MNIRDPSFIQIKTQKSPTCHALEFIVTQKLKPYYNTVYQLLHIKHPRTESYQQIALQIQAQIKKNIPSLILKRRIDQQTLEFQISKHLQKKPFFIQTKNSKLKKCKSVTKNFSLSRQQYTLHKQKDKLTEKFQQFRQLSKTLSQSTLKNKKKYNLLDRCNKIINNHFDNLQLQPKYIGGDQQDIDMLKPQQFRFKMQANKWLQNVLISNDGQVDSLVRHQKNKYLRKKGNQLNSYRGINQKQIQQCKQVIEQDSQLMSFSLSHTIDTTNVTKVKTMYEVTQHKLNSLLRQYKESKRNSPEFLSPQRRKSIESIHQKDKNVRNKMNTSRKKTDQRLSISSKRNKSVNLNACYGNGRDGKQRNLSQATNFPIKEYKIKEYRQYQSFKENQNQNPQSFKIGGRYSNFRSKEQKSNLLLRLKQHQKVKYTTKVMDVKRHRNLFLKVK